MATIAPVISVSATPGLQVDTFMPGLSYQAILNSLGSFLYDLKEMYYSALSTRQFTSVIQYTIYDSNGDVRTKVITTPVAPNQYQPSMYVAMNGVLLDGSSSLALNLMPAEQLQFIFYAKRLSVSDYIDSAGGINNFEEVQQLMRDPSFFREDQN